MQQTLEINGLTKEEVLKKRENGEENKLQKAPSKTLGQILKSNFLTMFNALNLILAVAVIIAGSPKNAIFAVVIITNSLIGVFQELKAKKIIEKLSVISKANCVAIRDGEKVNIGIEDIVKDDVIFLKAGDQILVDGEVILSDELEVDESMLTGESDSVEKIEKSKVLSGSFVVAGEAYMKVTKVGEETYSSKLVDEAKKFKIVTSEIQRDTNKLLKLLLFIIIPAGFILAGTQTFLVKSTWQEAVLGTVSGVLGMVPEGLVLITSATFILSIIKLAKYNTLIQELSATEVLARVDVLCLDKTGTITEGKLKVKEVKCLGDFNKEVVNEILASISYELPSKNPTQLAILENYKENPKLNIEEKLPFSSKRKYSGIKVKEVGSFVLGAPEIIMGKRYSVISEVVSKEAKKGRRVLVLARVENENLKEELKNPKEMALISIEDIIRDDAYDTLKFFKKEGVNVKIISGDNPVTVSAVAKRAGVKNADKFIDARELPEDIELLKPFAENYTVFGRVTPKQKKNLVKALQSNNHTVAMTGDGVNDVLALKEADCGISMANGADAARAVSQLVLMKSNFSALPKVVKEGRQQINNLEVVAQLFLSKTVYSVLFSIIFPLLLIPFPISPIQLTFIGTLAIGIPSFILALMPNNKRAEKGFLKRVLTSSIPNGLIMGIFVILTYYISLKMGMSVGYCQTLAVLILSALSLIILVKVSMPFNIVKLAMCIILVIISLISFKIQFVMNIFSFVKIASTDWIIMILVSVTSIPLLLGAVYFIKKKRVSIISKKELSWIG